MKTRHKPSVSAKLNGSSLRKTPPEASPVLGNNYIMFQLPSLPYLKTLDFSDCLLTQIHR